jgi:sulfoxide reductase heme-binding subunit YedZ
MSAVLPASASASAAAPRRRMSVLLHPAAKPLLFLAALGPFAWLLYGALANTLGANPAEALIRATGDWTLRFLCLTLAVTPLRETFKLPALARFRRMLGLFAYFYVLLHFASYGWLDMGFDFAEIAKDIAKRPFILVGFSAFLLLTPLAATSFNRAVKALGAKRWQALHKLVYLIAALGILHFFWMRAGKNDFAEVAVYAAIVATLLGWRFWQHVKKRRAVAAARAGGELSR